MNTRSRKYSEAELIAFGNYLISEKRKCRLQSMETDLSVEERLSMVYHADIENWKYFQLTLDRDDLKKGFEDISMFIVKSNQDLVTAQKEKDSGLCAMMKVKIGEKLFNEAKRLSLINGMDSETIYFALTDESNYTYKKMIETSEI